MDEKVLYEDMLVYQQESSLPGIRNKTLLGRFSNTRVATVFVTEEDLNDPERVEYAVNYFLGRYGMQPDKVRVVVMIARNPTDNWGRGFPFKIRISVFPREEYDLYTAADRAA